MYYNKVEICGINTSKLKTLTAEECKDLSADLFAVVENHNFDAFYIYPTVYYFVYEMDVQLVYDASGYVWLIYGK